VNGAPVTLPLSLPGKGPVRADLDAAVAENTAFLVHTQPPVFVKREDILRADADTGTTVNTP
jgi:hypothetical protein